MLLVSKKYGKYVVPSYFPYRYKKGLIVFLFISSGIYEYDYLIDSLVPQHKHHREVLG